ncbi:MAG: hypothetical protein AABY27_07310 [Pseudomonadota bacterium]
MILYSYGPQEGSTKTINAKCSHCGAETMAITMFQKVFSLFGLPIIPYSKSYSLHCLNCNSNYDPNTYNIDIKSLKMNYTWKAFIGWVIIIAFFSWLQVDSDKNVQKIAAYAQSPQIEDVVVYKSKDNSKTPYIFFKIIKIDSEKVYLLASKYAYNKLHKAYLEAEDAVQSDFDTEVVEITKDGLKNLQVEKWIRKTQAKVK